MPSIVFTGLLDACPGRDERRVLTGRVVAVLKDGSGLREARLGASFLGRNEDGSGRRGYIVLFYNEMALKD